MIKLATMFYESVCREKNRSGNVGASHQKAEKFDWEHSVLSEKQDLNTQKLRRNFEEISRVTKVANPPIRVFSTTVSPRDLKLDTHMLVHNINTPAKFEGHSAIITPFTSHVCDIQDHLSQNVNIAIYLNDHIRM